MKIITKAKNLELTDNLQNFVDEKIGGLKRFIDILKEDTPEKGKTLAEVFVELEKETKHHRKGDIFIANGKLVLPRKLIVVSARKDDIWEAVISMVDAFQVEIKQYKLKSIDKNRRQQRKFKKEISK